MEQLTEEEKAQLDLLANLIRLASKELLASPLTENVNLEQMKTG